MASRSKEMPPSIADADWLNWAETKSVFDAITSAGFAVRAVGGSVRNALLGEVVDEVDLATDAPPDGVIEASVRAGLNTIPTGLQHGTVTVLAGARAFEVTTLRRDVETHGRQATVAFTKDWVADAERRDFTMNALYADAEGAVFDPLGGYADLMARRVRFIGDPVARIREDYLRILRFFRINAQFGSQPYSRSGLQACVGERAGLGQLSAERVHGELLRLLVAPGAQPALRSMLEFGLLSGVLGGVPALSRFNRLVECESNVKAPAEPMRRLFALAVMTEEDVARLAQHLKLSNAETKRLRTILTARSPVAGFELQAAKALLYELGGEAFGDVALMAATQARNETDALAWVGAYDLPQRWDPPAFPIDGSDLIAMGLPEGPELGELLLALESQWVEGDFSLGREALKQRARAMIGSETGRREDEPA